MVGLVLPAKLEQSGERRVFQFDGCRMGKEQARRQKSLFLVVSL
jgi:hypothetical protein